MSSSRVVIADELANRPTSFVVGAHTVVVARQPTNGRWSVTVDGSRSESTFESEVDAWEDGVRTADRIDRGPAVVVR
jgi:hypothetical protein